MAENMAELHFSSFFFNSRQMSTRRTRLRRAGGESSSEDEAVAAGRHVTGIEGEAASESEGGAIDEEESGSDESLRSRNRNTSSSQSQAAMIRGCCMHLPQASPSASTELMQALTRTPQARVGATPEVSVLVCQGRCVCMRTSKPHAKCISRGTDLCIRALACGASVHITSLF